MKHATLRSEPGAGQIAELRCAEAMLELMESGDAIVGSTPRSRAFRAKLRLEIAKLKEQVSQR